MKPLIQIGVLVHRDIKYTLKTWQKTADYLASEIHQYHFVIVPLDFTQIATALEQNTVEFLISSPGIYVEFEALYGVNNLATLKRLCMGKAYTVFGGLIFCKTDLSSILTLSDLRGKRLVAAAEHSFGGWRAAWREIVEAGINPYRDFQSLQFTNSHDAVVEAVLQDKADVGTISTHILEQMALERKLDVNAFRIINQQIQYGEKFPFALSTRLYPEWTFAVTQKVKGELAEQVAIALLKLPKDHPVAIASQSAGWTISLNYQPVHECFQVLQVPPYQDFGKAASSFELAVKGSNDGLWDWNLETNEVFFSPRWKEMLGYAENAFPNNFLAWKQQIHPDDRDRVLTTFRQYFAGEIPTCALEYRIQHINGHYLWVLCRGTLLRDVWNKPYRIAGSHSDITQRKQAEEELRQSELQLKLQTRYLEETLRELKETQIQLIHSEKMSSLGQLVAGIAHEINNPVNFIYGNLSYLEDHVHSLLSLVEIFQQHHLYSVEAVQRMIEELELEFISIDLPQLLNSMRVGSERIRDIVRSLRNFSRLDEAEIKSVNLHEGIENTLLILQHRLQNKFHKTNINVVKEYGDLPKVECSAGQMNQVFLNILSNAIDALEEAVSYRGKDFKPAITIRTEITSHNYVVISIADNGLGINEDAKSRIFDPFFTTKPVGQGTGLGLSISYKIVVETHHGKLNFFSEPGVGTEFHIQIPIYQKLIA